MDDKAIMETIDKRHRWRRSDDFKLLILVASLAAALVAGGIAWGTATAAVAQKVDRSEFRDHVSAEETRLLRDSIESSYQGAEIRHVVTLLDSLNGRLTLLICDKKPAYCR